MKPSKLREHFDNRHGGADVSGHDVESLKPKRICFESRVTLPKLGFVSADKSLLIASYYMAYNVANFEKLHTIAEEVIKPCVLKIIKILLGKED